MEYTVINYLFDKGETVSEGICFTSKSKVTGLIISISCLHLPTFRSQAAIVSEKSTVFTFS